MPYSPNFCYLKYVHSLVDATLLSTTVDETVGIMLAITCVIGVDMTDVTTTVDITDFTVADNAVVHKQKCNHYQYICIAT